MWLSRPFRRHFTGLETRVTGILVTTLILWKFTSKTSEEKTLYYLSVLLKGSFMSGHLRWCISTVRDFVMVRKTFEMVGKLVSGVIRSFYKEILVLPFHNKRKSSVLIRIECQKGVVILIFSLVLLGYLCQSSTSKEGSNKIIVDFWSVKRCLETISLTPVLVSVPVIDLWTHLYV